MKTPTLSWSGLQVSTGVFIFMLVVSRPLRPALEASMMTHMLLQFPLLLLTGMLLSPAIPKSLGTRLKAWNTHGMAGLTFAVMVLALGMVPRLLDMVLVDSRLELIKIWALVLCGLGLRQSWSQAGIALQGFFLGNTLPMMAIVGWLYETAPVRVCNAYRLDEQQDLGRALGLLAACLAAVWFGILIWRIYKSFSSSDDWVSPFPQIR